MDSLTLLASLRPRSSDDSCTLIPPSSVLHSLHRTIPPHPKPGWRGSIPTGRTEGFRDNGTIKIRAGTAPSAPAVVPPAATATTSTAPAPTVAPYGAYTYAYAAPATQTPYRGSSTTTPTPYAMQYKPTGTSSYYQNAYTAPATTQGQSSYFSGATGQQPYWYGNFTAATGSATPQSTTTTVTMPTTYGTFFNSGAASVGVSTPTRTPAVANTVIGKQGQWNMAGFPQQTQSPAPTLPAASRAGQQQTSYYTSSYPS
jgi:hypothetical protein